MTTETKNIRILSSSDYDDAVSSTDVPLLVDFWAEWCGPCRAIAPMLEELADEFEGKVQIGKVNVDDNQELAQKLAISAIPTLVLYKNGEIQDTVVGVQTKEKLRDRIEKLIAS